MKKRLLQIAFTSLAFVMYLSVNAQNSGSCGTNATWEFSGSTLTITGTGEITTYSSTQPTDYPWFSLANSIQTVIINEGITNIPDWAFAMYENLRSISLPSTLTSIGNSALEETNLWNVSLPEGLQTIGHYAFMMIPITAICFPSTVTDIGEAAFAYCDDLATIGCYASTPPALFNNTVFDECPKIASVFVQEAKVADYKGASGWSDFGEKIQSPGGYCGPDGTDEDLDNDITKATWTFDMSTRTRTIQGTKMGQYNRPWESAGMGGSGGGFNPDNFGGYPKGIEHVIIGEGITKIPASSFYMEIGIKTVSLPSTLTAIGNDAFGECFNIDSIVCNATTPPTLGSQGSENFVIYGNVDWEHNIPLAIEPLKTILVPSTSVNAYKAGAGWSVYADYIKTEGDTPQSTTTTKAEKQNNTIYNLGGQRLEGNSRGIIIQNGKKLFIK